MTFTFISAAKVTIKLGDYPRPTIFSKPMLVPRRAGKQQAYTLTMQLFDESTRGGRPPLRYVGWSVDATDAAAAAQARYRTHSRKVRLDMHLAAQLRRALRR